MLLFIVRFAALDVQLGLNLLYLTGNDGISKIIEAARQMEPGGERAFSKLWNDVVFRCQANESMFLF